MNFYTNFFLRGGKTYVRGVRDGIRFKEKYEVEPTLFVKSPVATGIKSVLGDDIKPFTFDGVQEAKSFAEEQKECGNPVFGYPRYEYTMIDNIFEGDHVEYDYEQLNVCFLDIECESENGFPDPKVALETVNAITCGYIVNGVYKFETFGLESIETKRMKYPPTNYTQCANEIHLLQQWMLWMREFDSDIITGWNVDKFDITYLYNRFERVLGEGSFRKISPWGMVNSREVKSMYGSDMVVEIMGVSVLDYLDLYKKFTYTMQESYKLDYIANVELGEEKLDYSEYGSLFNLYREDYTTYIDYNIKDVELIMRLDDKKGLLKLACLIAYLGKTNYNDVFMNVRMWDVIIANTLRKQNIHVPYKSGSKTDSQFEGAFVKQPLSGKYNMVGSFDLESLYPSLIIQYNISPETMVNAAEHFQLTPNDVLSRNEKWERAIEYAKEKNYSLASNGSMYKKDEQGFLPKLMDLYFNKRKSAKKKMIEAKQQIQEIDRILAERGEA